MDNDMHEATFVWPEHDAQDVILTGTFDQWTSSIHLTKTLRGFEGKVKLPWGDRVLYKFVVDGRWRTTQSQPEERDSSGNVNNVYVCPFKTNLEAVVAPTLVDNGAAAGVPTPVPAIDVGRPTPLSEAPQVDQQVEEHTIPLVQDIPEAGSLISQVDTTISNSAIELGKEEVDSTSVPDQVEESLPPAPPEAAETASQVIEFVTAVVVPEVAPEVPPEVVPASEEIAVKETAESVEQLSNDTTRAPPSSTFDASNKIPLQVVASIPTKDTSNSTQPDQNPTDPSLSTQLDVEPESVAGDPTIVESEPSGDALTDVLPELSGDAPTDAEPESKHDAPADVAQPRDVASNDLILDSSEDVPAKPDTITEKAPTLTFLPDILLESADMNARSSPDDTTINENTAIDLTTPEPLIPSKPTPAPATDPESTTVIADALAEDAVLDTSSQVPTLVPENQLEPRVPTPPPTTKEPETAVQVAVGVDSSEEATVPNAPPKVQSVMPTGDDVHKDLQPTEELTEVVKAPEAESVAAAPATVPVDTSSMAEAVSVSLDAQPVQADSKETAISNETAAGQSVETAPSPTVDESPNGHSPDPAGPPASVSEPTKTSTPAVSDAAATTPNTTPPGTTKSGSARKKRLSIFGKLKNLFHSD